MPPQAVVTGMKATVNQVRAYDGIRNAEITIVPVTKIFQLQDMDGVKQTEKRFLR